jgi:outer membrane protein
MRRIIVIFLISFSGLFLHAQSQQLTRIAVVDMPKVYTAFFRDSRAVRQFEERSAKVQSDIDRMSKEIQELKSRQLDAAQRGEQEESLRLENQVYRRSEFLKDYYTTKTAELEDQKKKLMQSGSFLEQIYDEIRYIAESEGYTMVINLKENNGIIWHSTTIDVTDKLISNLLNKARR